MLMVVFSCMFSCLVSRSQLQENALMPKYIIIECIKTGVINTTDAVSVVRTWFYIRVVLLGLNSLGVSK